MLARVLGNKIGMTQVLDKDKGVIPVTVVDVSDWLITQVKVKEHDGYDALQLGKIKKKYQDKEFEDDWISHKQIYFSHIKEIRLAEKKEVSIGQRFSYDLMGIEVGDTVDVAGTSTGLGFQGVVKRWGFAGGPGAHGSTFHRAPGSSSHMRRQGEVIKGKKFPGHCGVDRVTVQGLKIVGFDKNAGYLLIKGAIPGKKNSLVYIGKRK